MKWREVWKQGAEFKGLGEPRKGSVIVTMIRPPFIVEVLSVKPWDEYFLFIHHIFRYILSHLLRNIDCSRLIDEEAEAQ